MAESTEWVRVRDTNTDLILPNLVPRHFLEMDQFKYLKEVPSARLKADRVPITEPVQPAAQAPGTTEVQEPKPVPKATATRGKAKTTTVTEN